MPDDTLKKEDKPKDGNLPRPEFTGAQHTPKVSNTDKGLWPQGGK